MATYTKKSTTAADAARLNLLEEKVRNLSPGEGAPPDIAQALDRLYDMTMRGGMHTSEDVTADMVDGMFWFRQQSLSSAEKKSIVSVTYGDTDALNRVKEIPFMHQVLGVDAGWNFAKDNPSGDQDRTSLVGNIYGYKSTYAAMKSRGQTVVGLVGSATELAALYDDYGSVCGAIQDLKDQIENLQSRVAWLESHT